MWERHSEKRSQWHFAGSAAATFIRKRVWSFTRILRHTWVLTKSQLGFTWFSRGSTWVDLVFTRKLSALFSFLATHAAPLELEVRVLEGVRQVVGILLAFTWVWSAWESDKTWNLEKGQVSRNQGTFYCREAGKLSKSGRLEGLNLNSVVTQAGLLASNQVFEATMQVKNFWNLLLGCEFSSIFSRSNHGSGSLSQIQNHST